MKDYEIKNLRQNVIDLEENITNLKSDLKIREERVTCLEDKLAKEKSLWRDLDREMEEIKKSHKDLSSNSSSEQSSCCYETDYESSPSYKKTSLRRTDKPVKTKKKVKNAKSRVRKSSKNGDCKKRQRMIFESENRRKGGDQTQMEEDPEFTNVHLKNAINYVKEHAPEALKGTSNEDSNTTDFKSRPTSGSASDNVEFRPKGFSFVFQRTGACMRNNCNFKHVNPNVAHPNYSIVQTFKPNNTRNCRRNSGPGFNVSSRPRPTKSEDNMPKQICFNYNRNGFCKFGSCCRFKHVNNNFNRHKVEFNSASFLGELKSQYNL